MKTVLTILLAVFSMSVFGQNQWIKQNPRAEIFDVKYLTENTIIRIGEDGIFKTTNDGADWINKWSQDVWDPSPKILLNKIFFIDSLTGWVSGRSIESHSIGFLFKTMDAGESWEVIAEIEGERFFDIYFLDENIGWAAVGPRYSYHDAGKILRTTNGGKNWIVVKENLEWAYKSLYFHDKDIGWAVAEYSYGEDGKIIKTTDGGNTWVLQTTDEILIDVFQITFTDKNNGWLIGLYSSGGGNWINGAFKTTNGGTNWIRQSNFEKIVPDIWKLNSLHFENSTTGWVSCKINEGNNIIRGAILNTSNGGIDWNLQIRSESYVFNSLDFYNGNKGIAVGTDLGVVKTENAGQAWNESFSISTEHLHTVFFMDENNGVVVGDGQILKTSNGGNLWEIKESETDRHLRSVFFIDQNVGWAVGGGTYHSAPQGSRYILKTSNGGEDWNVVISNSSDGLSSVYFTDSSTGYAVGAGGTILKTTNSGSDWLEQNSVSNQDLYSVFFIDDSNGWISGDHSTIIHTTNGGQLWEQQACDPQILRPISSVFFIDQNNGWAVTGGGGHIIKTTNGGNTWITIPGEFGFYLQSVFFSDSLNGAIAGWNGEIFLTSDGGNSWIEQVTGPNNDLESIFFVTPDVGYSVGRNGSILKYITNNQNYIPEQVELSYPSNDENEIPKQFDFEWVYSTGAHHYKIQCSSDLLFANIIFEKDSITSLSQKIIGLENNTTYYWRVQAENNTGISEWSDVWKFTTIGLGENNWIIQNNHLNEDFTSISFVDSNIGWATVGLGFHTFSDTYYQTTDGGVSWNPTSSDIEKFKDIEFFDDQTGVAAIYDSQPLYPRYAMTNDGGTLWTKFGNFLSYIPSKISLPSSTIGYAVVREWGMGNSESTISKIDLNSMSITGVQNPGFGANDGNRLLIDFIDEDTGWVVGKETYDHHFGNNFKRGFIYKTTDAGAAWELMFEVVADYDSVDSDYILFNDVDAVDKNNIWICGNRSYGFILNSTDGGVSWETKFQDKSISANSYPIKLSFSDPMNGCAIIRNETSSGNDDYLLQTSDGGDTWHSQYINLNATLCDIKMSGSSSGFAVGSNGLVLKFQDSTTVVGIAGNEPNLPTNFELAQNYPNPFNPETKIKFSIPKNSKVVLEVYNVLGQKVRELVNTDLSAGYHEVNFNSRGLASGVYIYRLQAKEGSGKNHNQFMEVKKMILLK